MPERLPINVTFPAATQLRNLSLIMEPYYMLSADEKEEVKATAESAQAGADAESYATIASALSGSSTGSLVNMLIFFFVNFKL